MKYENWKSSKEKWEMMVKLLAAKGRIDWTGLIVLSDITCGHCVAFRRKGCGHCSLYAYSGQRRLCSQYLRDVTHYDTFFFMFNGDCPRDKRKALRISEKILAVIINDEPKETNNG